MRITHCLSVARDFLVFAGILLAAADPAQAETYVINDLGTLGGIESRAYGLNELGQVVGVSATAGGQMHAFLWLAGAAHGLGAGMNDLGTLGGSESAAFGINDFGRVVGEADASDLPSPQAFLWVPMSGMTLAVYAPTGPSTAAAINGFGEMVGTARDPIGFDQAFHRSSGGALVFFSDIEPGDAVSWGSGIGYAGNLNFCGTYGTEPPAKAFRFGGETGLVLLQDLGFESYVNGMNALNQAVGSVTSAGWEHAALWEILSLTDLGTLGGQDSRAYGNNDAGQVVGFAQVSSEIPHAFVWQDRAMADLNDYLPSGSGWELRAARAINGSGQIVGDGAIGGETHAFLLTPCTGACDCHSDPQCDGQTDVFDIVHAVDVGFRNEPVVPDPNPLCPRNTTDVDCDGDTDVFDVVRLVNVAFRDGDPALNFCDPCL